MIDIHPAILAECIYPARRAEIPAHLFPISLGLERPPGREERAPMPLLVRLALGAAILACVWLAGCQSWPPPPCPPYCAQTPMATRTPTSPPPKPTTGPTSLSTRTAVPSPTKVPTPVMRLMTNGTIRIAVNLTPFKVEPPAADGTQLDVYASNTLLLDPPPARGQAKTNALEVGIRGKTQEQCLAVPCGRGVGKLGAYIRWSANPDHDHDEPNEKKHCGEGYGYDERIPIGPDPRFFLDVAFRPGGVSLASRRLDGTLIHQGRTLKRGAGTPAFALFFEGIPTTSGVGWAYGRMFLQNYGGEAKLEAIFEGAPVGAIGVCP